MSAESPEPQYATLEQQHESARLGMWVFLATEILFFAALFVAYAAYRFTYPDGFAEGVKHMKVGMGTANTFVLITSSLFVALALRMMEKGHALFCALLLGVAVLFGLGFMVIKGMEYASHVREGLLPGAWFHAREGGSAGEVMFVTLYWLMTGLHTLHVAIGLGALSLIAFRALTLRYSAVSHTPVELGGLYWHFVDAIWVFLYPLFYLVK